MKSNIISVRFYLGTEPLSKGRKYTHKHADYIERIVKVKGKLMYCTNKVTSIEKKLYPKEWKKYLTGKKK